MEEKTLTAGSGRTIEQSVLIVSALYLILPTFVFVALSFRLPAALFLLLLCGLASSPLVRSFATINVPGRLSWKTLVGLAVLALIVVVLAGAGHILFANRDWWKHDAVLEALADNPWPVTYAHETTGDLILRYYAAFYVVPAALAKVFNHADVFMLVWEWLGMFLSLAGISMYATTIKQRVVGLSYFLVFSGLDIIGWLVRYTLKSAGNNTHIEAWTAISYNSTFTLIAWVPQHALSAWLGILLIKSAAHDRKFLLGLPMLLASVTFWSLFVAIGLVPFVLLPCWRLLRRNGMRQLVDPAAIAGVFVFILIILFLTIGAGHDIHHGWLWDVYPPRRALRAYLWFIGLELVVIVVSLLIAGVKFRAQERIAVAVLLVLPFYVIGSTLSDFTMRSSIPAQFVIIMAFVGWMREGHPGPGFLGIKKATYIVLLPLVITTLIGVRTSSPEVMRAIHNGDLPRFPFSSQLLALIAWPVDVPDSQYVATTPKWLTAILHQNKTVLPIESIDLGSGPKFKSLSPDNLKVQDDGSAINFTAVQDESRVVDNFIAESKTIAIPGMYRIKCTMKLSPDYRAASTYLTIAESQQIRLPTTGRPGQYQSDDFLVIETSGPLRLHLDGVKSQGALVSLSGLEVERIDAPITKPVSVMLGIK